MQTIKNENIDSFFSLLTKTEIVYTRRFMLLNNSTIQLNYINLGMLHEERDNALTISLYKIWWLQKCCSEIRINID